MSVHPDNQFQKETKWNDFLCALLGHTTKPWQQLPDKFLNEQFDPSGIHWMHSHYRPHARWSLLAQHYPDRYESQQCRCQRCNKLIWEFYPKTLSGRVWGPADDYDHRIATLYFEQDFMGITWWRI